MAFDLLGDLRDLLGSVSLLLAFVQEEGSTYVVIHLDLRHLCRWRRHGDSVNYLIAFFKVVEVSIGRRDSRCDEVAK